MSKKVKAQTNFIEELCKYYMTFLQSGFKLINGSKEEPIKELKEVVSDSFNEAMFNSKSDNLPLLLKAWKAYEEKALLESESKLTIH